MLGMIALAVVVAYLVSLGMGLLFQRSILYARWIANQDLASMAEARARIPALEVSWLALRGSGADGGSHANGPPPARDGARAAAADARAPESGIEVWFVAGEGAGPDRPGPAVLFAHGNAERIDEQTGIIRGYGQRGVSVMLCEYRGYGRSEGTPTQARLVSDFTRCYDRLAARPEVDESRIVLHGRSLGSGVASAVAARRDAAAVVLRSPFYSVRKAMHRYGLWGPFVLDPYDNADALARFDGPVLVMHGRRDEVVPFEDGRRLHRETPNSSFVAFDSGHNDFPEDGERHWDAIERHLRDAGVLR